MGLDLSEEEVVVSSNFGPGLEEKRRNCGIDSFSARSLDSIRTMMEIMNDESVKMTRPINTVGRRRIDRRFFVLGDSIVVKTERFVGDFARLFKQASPP
jgi:hypothetical protein